MQEPGFCSPFKLLGQFVFCIYLPSSFCVQASNPLIIQDSPSTQPETELGLAMTSLSGQAQSRSHLSSSEMGGPPSAPRPLSAGDLLGSKGGWSQQRQGPSTLCMSQGKETSTPSPQKTGCFSSDLITHRREWRQGSCITSMSCGACPPLSLLGDVWHKPRDHPQTSTDGTHRGFFASWAHSEQGPAHIVHTAYTVVERLLNSPTSWTDSQQTYPR